MTSERTLRLAAGALAAAPAAIGVIVLLTLRTTLPDPVAVHFALGGRPDGSAPRDVATWAISNALVLLAIAIVAAAVRARGRSLLIGWLAPLTFASGLSGALAIWLGLSQRGLTDWRDATGGWVSAIAAILVGLALAALVTLLLRRLPAEPTTTPTADLRTLDLHADERVVWSNRLSWAPGPWLAGGLLAAGVLLGMLAPIGASLALTLGGVVAATAALLLSSLRATVDRRGLTIRWGPWGFPWIRLPLSRIQSATAQEIRPAEWGGWGYRGSVRFFGKAAAVLRRGPGLVLDLGEGRSFAVTVDDPETGAALLNALVTRVEVER